MTVMVTGASGVIGRALIPLLVERDEVRACVRGEESAEGLRALGAKVAVGRLDDVDAFAEVLRRVYTVVHLVGGPNQSDDDAILAANHRSVVTALSAARHAGVARFVFVSVPGASVDASHPYLRAKGLGEEAVENSGLEYAVVRPTHVYGLGGLWFTAVVEGASATPPFVVGDGTQRVAPVIVDDIAAVLAAIDDRDAGIEGTWAIEGPDVVEAAELVALLAQDSTPPVPLDPDEAAVRLTASFGRPVSPSAAAFFAMPSRADAPDAAAQFGVVRTALDEGMRRTLERAALGR